MTTQRQETTASSSRPVICVIDAATHHTGALNAARRQAALLRDRARFVLLVPEAYTLTDAETPEFERVIRLPIATLRRSIRSAITYLPALLWSSLSIRTTLRELKCDRLQVNDFYLASAFGAAALGFRGEIVTWIRTDPRRFGLIGRWWLRLAKRFSAHMVAVSEFIRSASPEISSAVVIYDPSPMVDAVTPQGGRMLFVGNYIEGKGQDSAIAAFHRIAGDHPGARLVFHGSTMGLAKNEAYLHRLRTLSNAGPARGRIALEGFIADKARLFATSLLSLTCSDTESFSLTCQEASAYGLPVIATRCGGPEEIVADGETGFLIDVGDVEALAGKMRVLLRDALLARSMGAKGAELMRRRFDEDSFVGKVAGLFRLPAAPTVAKR